MTAQPGAAGGPRPPAGGRAQEPEVLGLSDQDRDYLLAYVGEHLTLVRRTASGQRPVYWILGTGLVVGLAAHVGGFLLKTSAAAEPWALVADLLYALGWALWTGVIVVVFVQIWPEAKKREYQRVLDAYQAAVGRQAGAGGGQAPDPPSAQDA